MAVVSLVSLFTLFLIFHGGSCDLDYSYHGCKGPSNWPKLYPDCGAPNQSPVDLNTQKTKNYEKAKVEVISDGNDDTIPLSSYHVNVTNTGHTASMKLLWDPVTRAGPYMHINLAREIYGDYDLDSIHFHWGPNDSVGSEHTLNSERYPFETQAIFRKIRDHKKYAVLSVLYKKSEEDNPALAALASTLSQVVEAGSSAVSDKPVDMEQLIPYKPSFFIWYKGSLTSPPCTGDVLWFVDFRSLSASGREVEAFRKLKDKHGHLMVSNSRPLQPVGDRVLYQTYEPNSG